MASSSSSQETESSNQKASKSVNSSASKRKRGKGESSITVDVVLEAAAQVWDAESEEERDKKKRTFEEEYESPMFVMTPAMARMSQEYTNKMIADKKQRKADYLAARDAKLKSLGLENCDEYFV